MATIKEIVGYSLLLAGILVPPAVLLYLQFIVGPTLGPGDANVYGFGFSFVFIITFVLFMVGGAILGGLEKTPHRFSILNTLIWLGVLEYAYPFLIFPARIYVELVKAYPFAGIGLTILILCLLAPALLRKLGVSTPVPKKVQLICILLAAAACVYQFLLLPV